MSDSPLLSRRDLSALLQLAVDAAQEPAEIILDYFNQTALQVERKSDHSPVTEADREAEQRIRQRLEQYKSSETIDILGEDPENMHKWAGFVQNKLRILTLALERVPNLTFRAVPKLFQGADSDCTIVIGLKYKSKSDKR